VDIADFSFLSGFEKPKLIVQGTMDQYGSVGGIQDLFKKLPEPKKLTLVDGASHLFDGKLTELKNAIITHFPPLTQHSALLTQHSQ
jgi:alpha/beta superfamily hydrolase